MKATSHLLDSSEARAWSDDGFFIRPAVFSADEIEDLRGTAERIVLEAERAGRSAESDYRIDGNRYVVAGGATLQFEHQQHSQTIRVIEPFHTLDPRMDALIDDLRIVEPMRGLLGAARISLWTDKMNLKRPREGSRFRLHQDSPYWAHCCPHLDQLPNVMLALDDADQDNGCLRVIAGSHRKGLLPGIQDSTTLGPLFTDPRHFDGLPEVPVVVPAGSLIFFNAHTVHGSEPNRSNRPRRALVLTYQPADHRQFKLDSVRNAA